MGSSSWRSFPRLDGPETRLALDTAEAHRVEAGRAIFWWRQFRKDYTEAWGRSHRVTKRTYRVHPHRQDTRPLAAGTSGSPGEFLSRTAPSPVWPHDPKAGRLHESSWMG